MIVKSYDIKGEMYRVYIGICAISKDDSEKFLLRYTNGDSERLSIQEVRLEVEA